jgi:hypothetical protein
MTISRALAALAGMDFSVRADDVCDALARVRTTLSSAQLTLKERIDETVIPEPFDRAGQGTPAMKINQIEVITDAGRRVVQFSPPLDVDPTGDMPPQMQSLSQLVWDCLQKAAVHGASIAQIAPKAEA